MKKQTVMVLAAIALSVSAFTCAKNTPAPEQQAAPAVQGTEAQPAAAAQQPAEQPAQPAAGEQPAAAAGEQPAATPAQ